MKLGLTKILLLIVFSSVFAQSDYVVLHSEDTLFGIINTASIFQSPSIVQFKEQGFPSYTDLSVKEITSFYCNNKTFEAKPVSEEVNECSEIFLRKEISGCMSLYFFVNQESDTVFFVQKADYPLVDFNADNFKKKMPDYYREHNQIRKKIAYNEYTLDSIYVVVNRYNEWSKVVNPFCDFTRSVGTVKYWEKLSPAIDFTGSYEQSLINGFHRETSGGASLEASAKVDFLNHLFSLQLFGGAKNLRGRNSAYTLSKAKDRYFGLGLGFNLLKNKNPFNRYTLIIGYNRNFMNYLVEPVDCDCDDLLISASEGESYTLGIERQTNRFILKVRYHIYSLSPKNNNENIIKAGEMAINPILYSSSYTWQILSFHLGIRISGVPFKRQLKTI